MADQGTSVTASPGVVRDLSRDEMQVILAPRHWPTVDRWLMRGDACAVYENQDLGSPLRGHRQVVSFGSTLAQLEVMVPPATLPDRGGAINWRYRLVGVYRGPFLGGAQ